MANTGIDGTASAKKLKGVHPRLVSLVRRAWGESSQGFIVTEGLRTRERQVELVAAGASRTMNSRHLTGHAVDLACTVRGEVRWDWPLYAGLAREIKRIAELEGLVITWGGDWKSLRDGPHFEIDPKAYPWE